MRVGLELETVIKFRWIPLGCLVEDEDLESVDDTSTLTARLGSQASKCAEAHAPQGLASLIPSSGWPFDLVSEPGPGL